MKNGGHVIGEDGVGGFGPRERLGFIVVLFGVTVDGGLQSTMDRETPRLSRWRVSLEKNPSSALSQESDFGVK
jgi:hypothetical protein